MGASRHFFRHTGPVSVSLCYQGITELCNNGIPAVEKRAMTDNVPPNSPPIPLQFPSFGGGRGWWEGVVGRGMFLLFVIGSLLAIRTFVACFRIASSFLLAMTTIAISLRDPKDCIKQAKMTREKATFPMSFVPQANNR